MFKPAFANPGCFVCRIKEGHHSHHAETSCNFLKQINFYVCRHTRTRPLSPLSTLMCYDTGTTPKNLCNDASMFSELGYFQSPQQVSLGDGHSTITPLGQGTIDIIINDKCRIQQHAIMTNCTPIALMASSDHLKYKDCSIIGKHRLLNIIYPSFSFTITGSDPFEFAIQPGKHSILPILWCPISFAFSSFLLRFILGNL